MAYDFDRVIERRPTDSNKWRKYPADVLPLWVADMDFPSPRAGGARAARRVEHGVYGYGFEGPEFAEVFVDRLQKRYGWTVAPEAVVHDPRRDPRLQRGLPRAHQAGRRAADAAAGLSARSSGPRATTSSPATGPRSAASATAATWSISTPSARPSSPARARSCSATRTTRWAACSPARSSPGWPQVCLEHDIPIIADEIHCDLLFAGQRHVPIASLAPEIEQRTITLMAPSKTFNLAGLKVSVAVIPDASLRERFMAARGDYVQAQVNILGYAGALAAYRDGQRVARRADALSRGQPGLPGRLRPAASARRLDDGARGHLPRLARLPRTRARPRPTRSRSSWSARRWR